MLFTKKFYLNFIYLLFFLGLINSSFAADFSLSFDGTNDYVEVPFATSMNPTGDFTVNVWVKTGASGAWQSAVTSRSASTTCGEDTNQTSGYMLYIQPDEEWSFWRYWLRENYQDIFDKVMSESSPKQRALSNIFRILNIPQKDYFHNHKRGVYFCPLYSNYREFLTGKIKEKDLQPLEILSDWNDWWIKKSSDRVDKLKKENRINKDLLFHENITEEEMDNWLSSRGIN